MIVVTNNTLAKESGKKGWGTSSEKLCGIRALKSSDSSWQFRRSHSRPGPAHAQKRPGYSQLSPSGLTEAGREGETA